MKTRLIIARHGNTFRKGETPTRVGAKTDLPLVEEHRGRSIGKYLADNNLLPSSVYVSPLKRCVQTAQLALEEMDINTQMVHVNQFAEIDYGPDENKTDNEVMSRLGDGDIEKGRQILDLWNSNGTVPNGWEVDPQDLIDTWRRFAQDQILQTEHGKNTLLVSSNGVIRFAPYLTGNFDKFAQQYGIKVATGSVSIFEYNEVSDSWDCLEWNAKPYKNY